MDPHQTSSIDPSLVRLLTVIGPLSGIRHAGRIQLAQQLDAALDLWSVNLDLSHVRQPLIHALRAPGTTLPFGACRVFGGILEATEPEARTEFARHVYGAITAPARGWIMRCVSPRVGGAFRVLVQLGLEDRSARVRVWACEGVDHGEFLDLLPTLHRMQVEDPSPAVQEAAELVIPMLEKGYIATFDHERDLWWFDVRKDSRSTLSMNVERHIVNQLGPEKVSQIIRNGRGTEIENLSQDSREPQPAHPNSPATNITHSTHPASPTRSAPSP